MSPDHPAWQRPSCKALWGEQEEGQDKGSCGKTSESGKDRTFQTHRGLRETDIAGGSWLRVPLWPSSLLCVRQHSYACVYTQGLGTPTASQHNIFDLEKLSQSFLVLWSLDLESDALPIELPHYPMLSHAVSTHRKSAWPFGSVLSNNQYFTVAVQTWHALLFFCCCSGQLYLVEHLKIVFYPKN